MPAARLDALAASDDKGGGSYPPPPPPAAALPTRPNFESRSSPEDPEAFLQEGFEVGTEDRETWHLISPRGIDKPEERHSLRVLHIVAVVMPVPVAVVVSVPGPRCTASRLLVLVPA